MYMSGRLFFFVGVEIPMLAEFSFLCFFVSCVFRCVVVVLKSPHRRSCTVDRAVGF